MKAALLRYVLSSRQLFRHRQSRETGFLMSRIGSGHVYIRGIGTEKLITLNQWSTVDKSI